MKLNEEDFKRYMLAEYTFLKRPFIINEEAVFIGNSTQVIAEAKASFENRL
jgi:arsenate reductase